MASIGPLVSRPRRLAHREARLEVVAIGLHFDPPATLLTFTPLTLIPWPDAMFVATLVSAASAVFIGIGVVRLLGWSYRSPRALILMAYLLAFGPVIAALAVGQTSIMAAAAIVAAMLLERSGHRTLAGALLGLATVIKLTIGLPFLAYLLWRRRWTPFLASLLVLTAFTVMSVVRMESAGTPWLGSWLSNLGTFSEPGNFNAPDPENPGRVSLLNLQYPLSALISDPDLVNRIALIVVVGAALLFPWLRRGRDAHPDLLALAMVAVLTLLSSYHRYADAALLAVPVTWAASALPGPNRRIGVVVLVLCASFMLPIQNLILPWIMDRTDVLPVWLTGSTFWNAVVLAQNTWALVLVVAARMIAAAMERRRARTVPSSSSPPLSPVRA